MMECIPKALGRFVKEICVDGISCMKWYDGDRWELAWMDSVKGK